MSVFRRRRSGEAIKVIDNLHLFRFNRIETYRSHRTFPLSHRKTVFDFIYLTKRHFVRSKE